MKKNISTIIEITETYFKFAQATSLQGVSTIVGCFVVEHQGLSSQETPKTLSKFLVKSKIKLGQLTVVIPRQITTLFRFELPTHFDEEIRKMLDLQIVNHVPYSREEILFDYLHLGKTKSGYTKVLTVVVQKSLVNRYVNILEQANIEQYDLTLSSMGILQWYTHQKNQRPEGSSFPSVIINIDRENTEIGFCRHSELLFSREINVGTKDFSQGKAADLLADQLDLTLATYRKDKMGEEAANVFVVSTLDNTDELLEKIKEKIDVSVHFMDSMEGIPCETEVMSKVVWKVFEMSMAVPVGLLLSSNDDFMSFLPKEVTLKREKKKRLRELIEFGILFVVVLGLGILTLGFSGYQNEKELRSIKQEAIAIKPKVKKIQEKIRRVKVLNEEIKNTFFLPDFMAELHKLTPKGIAFNLIDFDGKGHLSIEGLAKQATLVNRLQTSLVSSVLFYDVSLQYTKKRKIAKEELTSFKIVCALELTLKE